MEHRSSFRLMEDTGHYLAIVFDSSKLARGAEAKLWRGPVLDDAQEPPPRWPTCRPAPPPARGGPVRARLRRLGPHCPQPAADAHYAI